MKIGNKGLTLVELLFSIILIGVVLGFLFQLLLDIEVKSEENTYSYENQLTKANLVYRLQNNIKEHGLSNIVDESWNCEDGELQLSYSDLNLSFYGKDGHLVVFNYSKGSFSSTDSASSYFFVGMGEGYHIVQRYTYYGYVADSCANLIYNTDGDKYYVKLTINVYNYPYNKDNNVLKNDPLDDIELSFIGDYSDIDPTVQNDSVILLGSTSKNMYIGNCRNHPLHSNTYTYEEYCSGN